jgi:hypothetical protein
MKANITSTGTQSDTIRAGVISSLILAICYLALTGLSDLPRVLTFIVLFAVCLALMMKSIADMLVWAFGLAARWPWAIPSD